VTLGWLGSSKVIPLPLLNPTPRLSPFTMSLPVGAAHHALGFLIGAAAGTVVYFWQNQETAFTGDSFSIRWKSTQWNEEVSRTASRPLTASPAGEGGGVRAASMGRACWSSQISAADNQAAWLLECRFSTLRLRTGPQTSRPLATGVARDACASAVTAACGCTSSSTAPSLVPQHEKKLLKKLPCASQHCFSYLAASCLLPSPTHSLPSH
jgi:hypothetical protein